MVITDPRHTDCCAQISKKQDGHNTYVIIKTMCSPGLSPHGFVATHALGPMM